MEGCGGRVFYFFLIIIIIILINNVRVFNNLKHREGSEVDGSILFNICPGQSHT